MTIENFIIFIYLFFLFIELPLYKKQCIYERFIQWGQTTTGLGLFKVDRLKKKYKSIIKKNLIVKKTWHLIEWPKLNS